MKKQKQGFYCLENSTISKVPIPNPPASSICPSGVAESLIFVQKVVQTKLDLPQGQHFHGGLQCEERLLSPDGPRKSKQGFPHL
eukprot:Gb_33521 [translate_table: standard]